MKHTRLDLNKELLNQIRVGRLRAGVSKRRKQTNLPVWLHPVPVERYYNRQLQKYVSGLITAIQSTLFPFILDIAKEAAASLKRQDDWADDAMRLLNTMAIGMDGVKLDIQATAADVAGKVDVWNDRQWRKIMKSAIGVELIQREPWMVPLTKSFVAENTGLITKMTRDMKENIGGKVQRGLRNGERHETIAKELKKEMGMTRNRAKLIARDQVSKLNGQITKERQVQAGIDDYRWRTANDERVRSTHLENNDKKFSWDKAPANTGHPGSDIQCRCYGEPNFDDILDEVDGVPVEPKEKIGVNTGAPVNLFRTTDSPDIIRESSGGRAALTDGVYFVEQKPTSASYGKYLVEYKVNVKKTLNVYGDKGMDEQKKKAEQWSKKKLGEYMDKVKNGTETIDAKVVSEFLSTRSYLESKGYDSMRYHHISKGDHHNQVVIFRKESVKKISEEKL